MTQLHFHNQKSSPVNPPPNASTNLSVLEKATTVYKLWHGFLIRFPRLSRYTIGAKIDQLFLEMLEAILQAGYTAPQSKIALIQRASTTLDMIKFFLRVAWEMQLIDHEKYARLAPPLTEIGNIFGGWIRKIQSLNSTKG